MAESRPALLPVFLDVAGLPCLVVGGGPVAERKLRPLIEGAGKVTLVAPEAAAEIRRLAGDAVIVWHRRPYNAGEAGGYFLCIAATGDGAVNAQVARDARAAGRLVNVADAPELSNFITPAVLRRDELQIAVSTSGACPALAKRLKEHMEPHCPAAYGRLLEILRRFRKELAARVDDRAERAGIIDRVVRSKELAAFLEGDQAPLEALLKRCVL